MAAKDKAEAAAAAARTAGHNPYVQRIIQDEELRDNMVVAVESARNAYARLSSGKKPAKTLMDDKKLHKELKRSSDALRDASAALRQAPKGSSAMAKRSRKRGIGRLLLVALIGGAVAMAASEGLRNKVLDALFGAEEEFDYSSNTTPASPPDGAPPS